MLVLITIILGVLPSLVWLTIFLREDVRPHHPKRLIVRVFIAGGLIAIPVLAAGIAMLCILSGCPETEQVFKPVIPIPAAFAAAIFSLIGVAFAEEIGKFIAATTAVKRDPTFNDPVDAMLFVIIASLGFAAVENVAFALSASVQEKGLFAGVVAILFMRFLSANLLHVVTSGVVGFAFAHTLFDKNSSKKLLWGGIAAATLIHWFYNGLLGKADALAQGPEALFWIGAALALLLLGGIGIWLMFQQLRAKAKIHAWSNTEGNIAFLD